MSYANYSHQPLQPSAPEYASDYAPANYRNEYDQPQSYHVGDPSPMPSREVDLNKFTNTHYRDLWAAIAFVLHVIVFLIAGFAMAGKYSSELTASPSNYNSSTYNDQYSQQSNSFYQFDLNGSNDNNSTNDGNIRLQGDVISLGFISLIVAVLTGLGWIWLAKLYPRSMIYISLYADVVISCLIAISAIATGNIVMGIIFIVFVVFKLLWIHWMKERIEFAAKILKYAIMVVQKYPATIFTALFSMVMQVVWSICWGVSAVAFYYAATKTDNSSKDNPEQSSNALAYFVIFLCLVSYYWSSQVLKNITHCTVAGVASTWYFLTENEIMSPTKASLKRSLTTSFGSICLGSLLIAVIRALRATLNIARNNQSNQRGGAAIVAAVLMCIGSCLLGILDAVMTYVNQYAFCQVAIYGKTYFEAAKATWELFLVRGFDALLNDSVIGIVLGFAALMGGLASGLISGIVAEVVFSGNAGPFWAWGLIGFLLGYSLTLMAVEVVDSSVISLFVCLCEDPAQLQRTKPDVYNDLVPSISARYPTITFLPL